MSLIGKLYCKLKAIRSDGSWDTDARDGVKTSNWKARFTQRGFFWSVCPSTKTGVSAEGWIEAAIWVLAATGTFVMAWFKA